MRETSTRHSRFSLETVRKLGVTVEKISLQVLEAALHTQTNFCFKKKSASLTYVSLNVIALTSIINSTFLNHPQGMVVHVLESAFFLLVFHCDFYIWYIASFTTAQSWDIKLVKSPHPTAFKHRFLDSLDLKHSENILEVLFGDIFQEPKGK